MRRGRNRGAGPRVLQAWPSFRPSKDVPMEAPRPLPMIRPMLWLAAAAFTAGFGGYLLVGLGAR